MNNNLWGNNFFFIPVKILEKLTSALQSNPNPHSEHFIATKGASQIEWNQSFLTKSNNQQLKKKLGHRWTIINDVMIVAVWNTLQQSFEKLVDQPANEVLMNCEVGVELQQLQWHRTSSCKSCNYSWAVGWGELVNYQAWACHVADATYERISETLRRKAS